MADDTMTAEKLERAETNADNSYSKYIESVEDTANSLKNMKNQLGEVKQAAKEADAEAAAKKATAQGQGVVSVADALKLMEQEKIAKNKYTQASAQYMGQAASAFASSMSNGAKFLGDAMKDAGNGVKDVLFDKSGLVSLAAGAGVAFLPNAIHSPAAKMVEGWLGLSDKNELDDGVQEKYVSGYEDPSSAATSAVADNMADKPGYNESNTGKGEDSDTEKQITQDGKSNKTTTQQDATNMSGRDLDELADLDGLLGTITGDLENSDNMLYKAVGKGLDLIAGSDKGREAVKNAAKGILGPKNDKSDEQDREDEYEPEYGQ